MVQMDGRPGGQELTIRKRGAPTKDANGVTVRPDDALITIDGCLAEMQAPEETQPLSAINGEVGWFFLPATADALAITPRDAIDYDDRTFEMRGPRRIRYTIDGDPVMVHCLAEWQQG